jgi:hypothetical protein
VLGYISAGGVACGKTNSHVTGFTISWSGSTGAPIMVPAAFHACPAGDPTIRITAVLSLGQYHTILPTKHG